MSLLFFFFFLSATGARLAARTRRLLLRLHAGEGRHCVYILVQRLHRAVSSIHTLLHTFTNIILLLIMSFMRQLMVNMHHNLIHYFCTCRTWDVTTASGVCETSLSVQRIPDFPILTTAWDAGRSALYCGGGGGSPGGPSTGKGGRGFSFIGTPIHMLSITDDF